MKDFKFPKVKWYGNRGVLKFSDGHYYYRGFDIKYDNVEYRARYTGRTHLKPYFRRCTALSISKIVDEIDESYNLRLTLCSVESKRIGFEWYCTSSL